MTSELPLPSRKLDVGQFVTEYLPVLAKACTGDLHLPWRFDIRFDAGAEIYDMHVQGGIVTRAKGVSAPLLTVQTDLESFALLAFEALPSMLREAAKQLPTMTAHLKRLATGQKMVALEELALHPGWLDITYVDDTEEEGSFSVCVGDGGPRRAKIRVTERDVWDFVRGGADLLRFVQSKARVEGDVAYAIEMARALEPR